MKAQMFIITMVFLTGLVVFVSQMLLSYASVNVSDLPERSGGYVVKEYVSIINDTIQSSRNCTDANDSIRELHGFLSRLVTEGYYSNIKYGTSTLPSFTAQDCQRFNDIDLFYPKSLMNVSMDVITGSTETQGVFDFKRLFIVFPQDKVCMVDQGGAVVDGDVHWRELWCKTEDPAGPCTIKWMGVAQDCKTCTDDNGGANDPKVRQKISVIPACSLGDTACPTGEVWWDHCTATETVSERTCSGGEIQGPEATADCNLYETGTTECWNTCDTVSGDVRQTCNDWKCLSDACADSGSDVAKGLAPGGDCTKTCVDTDSGSARPPLVAGTVTDNELCTAGQTACPSTTVADACADPKNVIEQSCAGLDRAAPQTINCNSYMSVSRGYGCENGRCFDCDEDHDGYCASPYDAPGDCCPTCELVYPDAPAQTVPIDDGTHSFNCRYVCNRAAKYDYNCNGFNDKEYNVLSSVGKTCTTVMNCYYGWTGSILPNCGVQGVYVDSMNCQSGKCVALHTTSMAQACS